MKAAAVPILFGCMIFMAGCAAEGGSTVDKTETLAENIESDNKNYDVIYDKYMDIDELPVLDMDVEREYVCQDRTLIMEDSIENELEYDIYNYYYDIVSADFESFMDNIGENESFKTASANEEKNFNEGRYNKEYDIYELTTVSVDDVKKADDMSKDELLTDVEDCGLDQYALVKADLSWKYNEAKLEASPQLPEGRYTRYFLLGTVGNDPEIKIYQVYWDEFL